MYALYFTIPKFIIFVMIFVPSSEQYLQIMFSFNNIKISQFS